MILLNKKDFRDRVRPHTSPICGKGKPFANLILYHHGQGFK
jgi:hypothetical protein